MGCCLKGRGFWKANEKIVLEYMQGKLKMKVLWSEFKINTENHNCMELTEFEYLLRIVLKIFKKIERNSLVILRNELYMNKNNKNIDLNASLLPTESSEVDVTIKSLLPTLSIKFDEDGDGVFNYVEFSYFARWIRDEYKKLKDKSNVGRNSIYKNNKTIKDNGYIMLSNK